MGAPKFNWFDIEDPITRGVLASLLIVGFVFLLLAGLIPRDVPCSLYKTNLTQLNSSLVVGSNNFLGPVVCFGSPDSVINLTVKGGFYDLLDFNGQTSEFTFNTTKISNATIYRHKCNDLNLHRQPPAFICSSASMLLPYIPPLTVPVTTMNLTVVNPEPCQDKISTRPITVLWEELLDVTVTQVTPNLICNSTQEKVKINGHGFLKLVLNKTEVLQPTAVFDGQPLLNVTVNMHSCQNYTLKSQTAHICTEISGILRAYDSITENKLTVNNPMPCSTSFGTLLNAFTLYPCM